MKIEILERADREGAVRVLVESFRDYPVMRYFLEVADGEYEQSLRSLMRFYCDTRFARGFPPLGIREGDEIAATALVSAPTSGPRPPEVEKLFTELERDLGVAAMERMRTYDDAGSEHMPAEPYHYLGMLGVLPGSQGGGYGGALVAAVKNLATADADSTGVCLHTEVESNVPLYEHLGFEILGIQEIAGMRSWCMFWPIA
jgi:GNAT superfamily N-acetyltransferase